MPKIQYFGQFYENFYLIQGIVRIMNSCENREIKIKVKAKEVKAWEKKDFCFQMFGPAILVRFSCMKLIYFARTLC